MPIHKLFNMEHLNKILLYAYIYVLFGTDKQNTAILSNPLIFNRYE